MLRVVIVNYYRNSNI